MNDGASDRNRHLTARSSTIFASAAVKLFLTGRFQYAQAAALSAEFLVAICAQALAATRADGEIEPIREGVMQDNLGTRTRPARARAGTSYDAPVDPRALEPFLSRWKFVCHGDELAGDLR